jgi:hypothetical protein
MVSGQGYAAGLRVCEGLVPSATLLPCIGALPTGWSFETAIVHTGEARFTLGVDQSGPSSIAVNLTPKCDVSAGEEVVSDEPTTHRFERFSLSASRYSEVRTYRFAGGCVTYRFSFPAGRESELVPDAEEALGLEPRATLVAHVQQQEGLALCGTGVPCQP